MVSGATEQIASSMAEDKLVGQSVEQRELQGQQGSAQSPEPPAQMPQQSSDPQLSAQRKADVEGREEGEIGAAVLAEQLEGQRGRPADAELGGSGLWQAVCRSERVKQAGISMTKEPARPARLSKSPSPVPQSSELQGVVSGEDEPGPESVPPPRPPSPLLAVETVKGSGDEQSDSEASCRSTPPGDAMQDSINREASELERSGSRPDPQEPSNATTPPGAKRKRKDVSVSRLSFSDELDEESDMDLTESKSKMSAATEKRFKLEERNRRRREVGISFYTNGGFGSQQHPDATSSSPGSARTAAAVRVVDDDDGQGPCLRVQHGVCGRQGKRPYMEDSYLTSKNFMRKGYHLFGIFDGHGGSRASNFARDNIERLLQDRLNSDPSAEGKEVAQAISGAFTEVDRQFLQIARDEQLKDGTTALLALLRHNTLHMGWVGDSRCILSRQGRYVRVSEDHKPDRPDERKAVEARGGQVIFRGTYRVAGPTALAVSRAIGDILMKEPRKLVVADPEINTIDLHPEDEFLVMASDGLYDVMGDQNVIDTVSKHLKENKSCQGAAEHLTDLAIEKGSMDNVTVLIVQFLWGGCPDEDE